MTFEPRSVPTSDHFGIMQEIQRRLVEQIKQWEDFETWKILTEWVEKGPWRSWG